MSGWLSRSILTNCAPDYERRLDMTANKDADVRGENQMMESDEALEKHFWKLRQSNLSIVHTKCLEIIHSFLALNTGAH